MSRFFSSNYSTLVPYTPGEQPQDKSYVKLNTNESPFPPSPYAQRLAREAAGDVQLYSDPECRSLVQTAATYYGIDPSEILFGNGSDEILNFAFMAYCDASTPARFPDISYGFYPVFAKLNHLPYKEMPLNEDYTINLEDYLKDNSTIFIANPNAPTGIALSKAQIETVLKANPNHVVVIDEAYVDFGAESCVSLIHDYPNLLVVQTCSKSRSLAGGRLGFAIGNADLIRDLNTIKYSTNPYNVNRMTMAAGVGAFIDTDYFAKCCNQIRQNRERTVSALTALGFTVLPSKANFIFAKHPSISGMDLYVKLKEKGVLIRHFEKPRLKDYNRITIGSMEQMVTLLDKIKEILEEKQ